MADVPEVKVKFSAEDSGVQAAIGALIANLQQLKSKEDQTTDSTRKFTQGMSEARGAAQLLGEEVGVKLNRHLAAVIAQSEIMGPLFKAAFSTVAAIGFIEVGIHVYDKIIDITDAMGGWTEAAKKNRDEIIADNRKILASFADVATGMRALIQTNAQIEALELKKQQVQNPQPGVGASIGNAALAGVTFGGSEIAEAIARQRELNALNAEEISLNKLADAQREQLTKLTKANTEEDRSEKIEAAESAQARIQAIQQVMATLVAEGGEKAKQSADYKKFNRELIASEKELHRQQLEEGKRSASELIAAQSSLEGVRIRVEGVIDPIQKVRTEWSRTFDEVAALTQRFPSLAREFPGLLVDVLKAENQAVDKEIDQLRAKADEAVRLFEKSKPKSADADNLGLLATLPVAAPTLTLPTTQDKLDQFAGSIKEQNELIKQLEGHWEAMLDPAARYAELTGKIQILAQKGLLSAQQEGAALAEAKRQELEADAKLLASSDKLRDGFKLFFTEMQLGAQSNARIIGETLSRSFETLHASVSRAFGSMLTEGKSFSESMRGVWSQLTGEIIDSILRLAEKWIIQHILMAAASKVFHIQENAAEVTSLAAKTATNVAANTTVALSDAGLAAAGTFAWYSAVSPPIAPAMAAAAYAQGAAWAGLAAFEQGGMVPETSPILAHKGEYVLNASATSAIGPDVLAAMNKGLSARFSPPRISSSFGGLSSGLKEGGAGIRDLHYSPTINHPTAPAADVGEFSRVVSRRLGVKL